jgi:hypothetical protein
MNITRLTLLILLLGSTGGLSRAQANSAQTSELSGLSALANCRDNVQPGTMVCSAVLPASVDTKKSKVGDHVLIKVSLATAPAEQLITTLDAAIIEVHPAAKGRSMLRLRIDRAVSKDGRELPVQVNVLALASQSSVTERWDYPGIVIADRFPPIPEDEQRLPGERKFSADQRHSSPLDATPDMPVHRTMICNKKAKKGSGNPCVDLLEARGIYGYKGVMLEPGDAASPADSVLSSTKNIRLRADTVMVLEVKGIHVPRKS